MPDHQPEGRLRGRRRRDPAGGALSSDVRPVPGPSRPFDDLLGVRSSKGRYYSEYRHSSQDLQRALLAVNSLSRLLADAPGDARSLVDSTLPVIAELLSAQAVVLVSAHPGLGGARVCLTTAHPLDPRPVDDRLAGSLVDAAEAVLEQCPPGGLLRLVPELGAVLLLAPLPGRADSSGYVVAAVPPSARPDGNDLAILGTLTNQLAGAIESSRRLAASEASRLAADEALRSADRQAAALERRNALLKQARHELVGAQERQVVAEERQRIARDLHDSVAQHVLSMGMQVEWCRTTSEQPEVVERLGEIKDLARSTVHHIRSAIFELSTADGLPRGLGLQRLADQHRVHGLHIEVRAGDVPALPAAVEKTLYMVAKEALFNTVIHAEAERAWVELGADDREVRVRVSDDGSGRAAELLRCLEHARRSCADGYHRGLVNIEQRAHSAGGQLVVEDLPGRGVALEVRVPRSPR